MAAWAVAIGVVVSENNNFVVGGCIAHEWEMKSLLRAPNIHVENWL